MVGAASTAITNNLQTPIDDVLRFIRCFIRVLWLELLKSSQVGGIFNM